MFGEGTIDFPPIFRALREIDYQAAFTSSSAATAMPAHRRSTVQWNSSVRS